MKHTQLISENLRLINYLYNKNLAKELSSIKINHHFEVLLILARQKGPITQNKLAELLHVDKSRVVSIVFSLEQRKMLIVKTNPADRRQHYISLSPHALVSIPFIETKIKEVNALANTGISEEKLDTFFEVAEAIMQNLTKSGH